MRLKFFAFFPMGSSLYDVFFYSFPEKAGKKQKNRFRTGNLFFYITVVACDPT